MLILAGSIASAQTSELEGSRVLEIGWPEVPNSGSWCHHNPSLR